MRKDMQDLIILIIVSIDNHKQFSIHQSIKKFTERRDNRSGSINKSQK